MAEFFVWRDDYLVGHPVIDYDHRNLANLINALAREANEDADHDRVSNAMHALTRYVDEHFSREETLFKATDYPSADEHTRQHETIAGMIRALATSFARDPKSLDMDGFLAFLGDWLSGHIVRIDKGYAPYLPSTND